MQTFSAGQETQTGVMGPSLKLGGWFAAQRAGQTMNALHQGAISTIGNKTIVDAARTLPKAALGWRAIDDEMLAWRSSQGIFRKGLSKIGFAKEGWMATGAAPSFWVTGVNAIENATGTSRNLWRVLEAGGYGTVDVVDGAATNVGFFKSTKAGIAAHEASLPAAAGSYKGNMTSRGEAVRWTSQALKLDTATMKVPAFFGERLGGTFVKDYAIGGMFDVTMDGTRVSAGPAGAKSVMDKVVAMGERGRYTRGLAATGSLGDDALGIGLKATKFAKVAAPIAGGLLRFAPYVGLALTVKDVATFGYDAGEMYFYKLPKRGFGTAMRSINRPAFSSPMASGMPDSPAAVNSRQRAVTAIQSSRLNARSALGQEAALVSGHFG